MYTQETLKETETMRNVIGENSSCKSDIQIYPASSPKTAGLKHIGKGLRFLELEIRKVYIVHILG